MRLLLQTTRLLFLQQQQQQQQQQRKNAAAATAATIALLLGRQQHHRYNHHQHHHQHERRNVSQQPNHNNNNNEYISNDGGGGAAIYTALTFGGITFGYYIFNQWDNKKQQQQKPPQRSQTLPPSTNNNSNTINDDDEQLEIARLWHKTIRNDLPTYTTMEIESHNQPNTKIWITYGCGVYDVTDFAPNHPGGNKIMMAAGNAIDPFWSIYQQHNTIEILQLLETFRIGNLEKKIQDDAAAADDDDVNSIWLNEPKRHELLKATSARPFNAEPPIGMLVEKFYTPSDIFYIRNHLPVPLIDAKDYELQLEIEGGSDGGGGGGNERILNLNDIKKLPKYTVTAAIMCGGNRRSEMTEIKSVKGLSWGAGAVGNAQWTGARLCDLLFNELNMNMKTYNDFDLDNMHVIFEGGDLDPTSHPYGASIPLAKALDPRGDVLLAYEMNGEPLTRDHGYPIRVIVPGTVGARNVKWLTRIVIANHESDSHWQQNDYKGFNPSTDWDTVDFSKSYAIQSMPVTSAICTPSKNQFIQLTDDNCIEVRGYAWSGGGRRIIRVDLTCDEGKTWHNAELEQENLPDGRHYGWSLWTAKLPISEHMRNSKKPIEIWSKAVDSAYNVQPENFAHIWNLRGVLANAYHKVKVHLSS